jgi:enterochelin esterase-like enzyme
VLSSLFTACSVSAVAGEDPGDSPPLTQKSEQETAATRTDLPVAQTATETPIRISPFPTETFPNATATPTKELSAAYANKRITEEAPLPACLIRGGQVIQQTFSTNLIPLPLDYRVYLPPCYRQSSKQRYPLLVLIHGQSYTDDQWDRLGVDEVMDQLIMSGDLPPFIILMPRDRYGGESPENNFARVVVEELLPFIDETYRTLPERQHRAVGGLSRGAGWSVHIGMVYWQEFSRIGAHSPAIFYSDAQKMRTWLDTIPKEQIPQVFVDIGERDRPEILDSAHWFADLLNEKRIAHEWYLFAGFHNEAYWSSHLEQYLKWYAKNW